MNNSGFLLGKTLFYDSRLSRNGRISCASCHQQSGAFSNLNTAISTGANNLKGTRNTPAIFNLAWQEEFMWDGRLNLLELVPVNAITSPKEMDNSMENVVKTLNQDSAYLRLFRQSFGDQVITQQRLLNALSQFTIMLISSNSKFDKVTRREGSAQFTEQEFSGYRLFLAKCNGCHSAPLFTDRGYHNNGLDLQYSDSGRDSLTHQLNDLAKFKTPSLRNVEITGPYMHDGRFKTLTQVLEHYNSGVKNHANLDPLLKNGDITGIKLGAAERENIIAFLKTLTDLDLINNRQFNLN
ncbi:MAG: cytochrome-c peroxidase [Pedobacter sp.]|nr:MAG: cytochrome-c peroxidase [Pedobacter sp.]